MAISRAKKARTEQDLLLYVQRGTFYRIPFQALEQFKLDEKQADEYIKTQEKYFRAGTPFPTCPATRPVLIPPILGCPATRLIWSPSSGPGASNIPDPRIMRSWKRDSHQ